MADKKLSYREQIRRRGGWPDQTLSQVMAGATCHAVSDGDCTWSDCPQNRDGEPRKNGRHCPLDPIEDEEGCAMTSTSAPSPVEKVAEIRKRAGSHKEDLKLAMLTGDRDEIYALGFTAVDDRAFLLSLLQQPAVEDDAAFEEAIFQVIYDEDFDSGFLSREWAAKIAKKIRARMLLPRPSVDPVKGEG